MAGTSNTLIQLKYSSVTSTPPSLSTSEPAYSFVSEKFFIGTDASSVVAIGGQFYTRLLDANTSLTVPNSIVTRDSVGSSDFNDLMANTLNANTTVFAGLFNASPLAGATNPLMGAGGNANNYVQNYIRNINAGGSASADFVAYSDNGTDVSGWIDIGITSSTYNEGDFAVTGPGEGYIFMSATNGSGTSGNLVIATDSTGVYNDIVFQTGGFTDKHTLAHFRTGQGLVIDATTESTSNATGALVVNGGVGIKGTLYVDSIVTPGGGGYVTSVTPHSGPGISITDTSTTGGTYFTVNNEGVISLTANTGEVTSNAQTGNIVFGLADTDVVAGTYGGSDQIPTIVVDAKGRVTYAGNSSVSTSFNLYGDSGVTVVGGGGSLTIQGNTGGGILTSAISGPNLDIFVDDTVFRSNTSGIGPQVISTNVTITGNLTVIGQQTISNTTIVQSQDSLIKLADGNVTDALDIGFFGQYASSGTKYAGLFRKAADKFYLFKDVTTDPTSNVVTFSSANRATLDTNITGGSVSGLSQAIAIADGGTNSTSYTTGQLIHFNGSALVSLANTGTAGTYGGASKVPVITTDALGRVSAANVDIAIGASQVTSGILAIARGGSNNDTYTAGALLQYDGTKFISTANTGTAGFYGDSSHIVSLVTDAYGRVTSATNTAITISASAITSGTLGVVNGGTGSSSFNTKGVVVSDSSSTTGALTALTGSAYQVLQLNSSGVPVFGGLNGGTF